MKNSEKLHLAQIAVVTSPTISPENKLNVLWLLRECESMEQWKEEHEAEINSRMEEVATDEDEA